MNEQLLEVWAHEATDYKALVYYEGWRVAILNYADKFLRENTTFLERHDLTDEVFVLLNGACALYIGSGGDADAGEITLVPMEQGKLYNVKKGVWHNLTCTPGTALLIVENADTSPCNSPKLPVTPAQLPVWEEEPK